MILLTEKVEPLLMDHVKEAAAHAHQERAIVIPSLQHFVADERRANIQQEAAEQLATALKERDAKLYSCQDGDIIIIGRELSVQDYKKVQQVLMVMFQQPEHFAQYYEKGVSWYQFSSLCKEKLERFLAQEEHRRLLMQRQKKEQMRSAALHQALPEEMIHSISKRRCSRKTPEILVVEDDPFSRTLVRSSLRHDMNVTLAQDGRDAISSYVIKAPDLTFLDLDLPDVNGHEVMARILEIDAQACIIILSGHGDRTNITRAMQHGAKGFIAKPFTKDKLMHYVRQIEAGSLHSQSQHGGSHAH